MKKVIESVVPEKINILDFIINLSEKDSAWIYLSYNLIQRLKDTYAYDFYVYGKGKIFYIDERELHINEGEDTWNKVSQKTYFKLLVYDPDVIYFLS